MPEIDAIFIAACVIVVFAAATAGLAGFGFSIVSVPVLLLLYDPGTVVAVNKFLTLGTTWIILISVWRSISVRLLLRLVPAALIGVFAGIGLLKLVDAAHIKLLVGIVVSCFAVFLLIGGVRRLPERPWMGPVAGFFSGTLSASTGLGGPSIVLFFTVIGVSVDVFRATSVIYFLLIDLVAMPSLMLSGNVTWEDAWLSLALAPFALAGRYLGSWLVPYVSPVTFRRFTLCLLILTGAISIVNGLAAVL